jgi:integrase
LPLATQPKACVYDHGRSALTREHGQPGSPIALSANTAAFDKRSWLHEQSQQATGRPRVERAKAGSALWREDSEKEAELRHLEFWVRQRKISTKTERFSRTEGKTPALVDGEVQTLLEAVDASTHTGLRDRALLAALAYTFARIGSVVNLKVEDHYPSGKRFLVRFKEKGGKEKELPSTTNWKSSLTSTLKQPA